MWDDEGEGEMGDGERCEPVWCGDVGASGIVRVKIVINCKGLYMIIVEGLMCVIVLTFLSSKELRLFLMHMRATHLLREETVASRQR